MNTQKLQADIIFGTNVWHQNIEYLKKRKMKIISHPRKIKTHKN